MHISQITAQLVEANKQILFVKMEENMHSAAIVSMSIFQSRLSLST